MSRNRIKQKKGKDTPVHTPQNEEATSSGDLWEVDLEDTVIFPEGGGQPFDTGLLRLGAVEGQNDGVTLVVEGCLRRKLESVHLVRVPSGMEETLSGAEGKEVEVSVDWERRMDQVGFVFLSGIRCAMSVTHAQGAVDLGTPAHGRCRYIRANTYFLPF